MSVLGARPPDFDRHRDARRIAPCRARAAERGHTGPA